MLRLSRENQLVKFQNLFQLDVGEFATSIKIIADADAPILSMDAKVRGLVNDSVPAEFADKTVVKIPATAALEDTDGSESLYIKVSAPQTDSNGCLRFSL